MITKFRYFINEACDVVSLGNGKEVHYYREDNYTFLYFDGKMKHYRPLEDSQLYMDFSDNVHSTLRDDLARDNGYSEDYVNNHTKFSGRIYLESKIIAFWDYPNKKEFVNIINDLERVTEKQGEPVKIWNNGWRIEIYAKKGRGYHNFYHPDYERFDVPEINNETKIIPVEWYVDYRTPHKPKLTLQQRQLMYSESMKNIKNDLPKILYHATPSSNIDSILKNGLVPKLKTHFAGAGEKHEDRIFLSIYNDPYNMNLPMDKINSNLRMLTISSEELNKNNFYPDDWLYWSFYNDELSDESLSILFPKYFIKFNSENDNEDTTFSDWLIDNELDVTSNELEKLLRGKYYLSLPGGLPEDYSAGEIAYKGIISPSNILSINNVDLTLQQRQLMYSENVESELIFGKKFI